MRKKELYVVVKTGLKKNRMKKTKMRHVCKTKAEMDDKNGKIQNIWKWGDHEREKREKSVHGTQRPAFP